MGFSNEMEIDLKNGESQPQASVFLYKVTFLLEL